MGFSTGLTVSELIHLDTLLKEQSAMPLVHLHGYLTAVVSGPSNQHPLRWLALIWEDAKRVKSDDLKESFGYVIRLHSHIVKALEGEKTFFPLLSVEGKSYENMRNNYDALHQWCQGYLEGIQVEGEAWREGEEKQMGHLYYPILILGSDDQTVKQRLEGFIEDVSIEELRRSNADALLDAIRGIHTYWRARERAEPAFYDSHFPKVGRNDPCPCGSGKKYKKCCLQKMIN